LDSGPGGNDACGGGDGSHQEEVAAARSGAGAGIRDAWVGNGAVHGAVDGEVESVVVGIVAGAACQLGGAAFHAVAVDSVLDSVRDVFVAAGMRQYLEAVALLWGDSALRVWPKIADVGDPLESLQDKRPAVVAVLAHAGMAPCHAAVPDVVHGSGCLPQHHCTPLVAVHMLTTGYAAQVQVDAILLLLPPPPLRVLHRFDRVHRV